MKIIASKNFSKQLAKLNARDKLALQKMYKNITETTDIAKLSAIKKLQGYNNVYRYRIGDYRIGIVINDNVVELKVLAHRKDIYKIFP